tara:strand:+ start:328 stop:516 length:189 start_codon:yes stop_codon:yes gene_type:complete
MIIDITFSNQDTVRTTNVSTALEVAKQYIAKGFRILGFKYSGKKDDVYSRLEMYIINLNKSV